jgi:hypothetical protein
VSGLSQIIRLFEALFGFIFKNIISSHKVEEQLCLTRFPTPPPPEPYDKILRNQCTDFNETLQGGVWGQDAMLLLHEVLIGQKLKHCIEALINY